MDVPVPQMQEQIVERISEQREEQIEDTILPTKVTDRGLLFLN